MNEKKKTLNTKKVSSCGDICLGIIIHGDFFFFLLRFFTSIRGFPSRSPCLFRFTYSFSFLLSLLTSSFFFSLLRCQERQRRKRGFRAGEGEHARFSMFFVFIFLFSFLLSFVRSICWCDGWGRRSLTGKRRKKKRKEERKEERWSFVCG